MALVLTTASRANRSVECNLPTVCLGFTQLALDAGSTFVEPSLREWTDTRLVRRPAANDV